MASEGATETRWKIASRYSGRGARRVEAAALVSWKPSVLRPWPFPLQSADERVTFVHVPANIFGISLTLKWPAAFRGSFCRYPTPKMMLRGATRSAGLALMSMHVGIIEASYLGGRPRLSVQPAQWT